MSIRRTKRSASHSERRTASGAERRLGAWHGTVIRQARLVIETTRLSWLVGASMPHALPQYAN